MKVVTIGLDLAKNIFQVHGVDREAIRFCESGYAAYRWRGSSPTCRPVRWGWKPAAARTTGAV